MKNKISQILKFANISVNNYSFIPLDGGANNQVYKIILDTRKKFILKNYFRHKNDLRQRLISEFYFLTFAWENKITCIPKPLYFSKKDNLALYSYLPGRLANKNDVNDNTIQKAINFFLSLNKNKDKASKLLKASEACFSINEHVDLVENRIKKLTLLSENTLAHKNALHFVKHSLIPIWEKIKRNLPINDAILNIEDICISPSDFGLHNTIINDKTVYFIDFEYAGVDDPAKVVCDFFCQPKIPISLKYFDKFAKNIASTTSNPKKCLDRIKLLFPIYQIKWCCIILNVFIKTEKNRRLFSNSEIDYEKQLQFAKKSLEKIQI